MNDEKHDEIRGLRAAAKLAERSPSGLQKMVDNGDVPARKVDGVYVFAASDLEALRPGSSPSNDNETTPELPDKQVGADEPSVPVVPAPAPAAPVAVPAVETSGDIAATAFALFEAGKSPTQVVIETKNGPDTVERLYETWLRFRAMDTSSTAAQSRISAVAADVISLKAQVENLADLADAFRRAIDVHDQNVPTFTSELSSIAERVDAIEQQLADPTFRKWLDSTNDMVGNLIVRVTNFERTFQSWVPYMQAICQRMRA